MIVTQVVHALTVLLGDDRQNLIREPGEPCWCGAKAVDAQDGRELRWCHEHAPRCRSGAHFLGSCLCLGWLRNGAPT